MLKSLIEVKKEKPWEFQVLLLNNDASQEVEVREAKQVDFLRVQEYLAHGGSVFITSTSSQKLTMPNEKNLPRNKNDTRKVTASQF